MRAMPMTLLSRLTRQRVTTVLALAGMTATIPLVAQPGARSPVAPFSSLYVTAGTMQVDVSRLNPHFERTDLLPADRPGFFTISNDAYSIGLGGYGVVQNRIVLGAEYHIADVGEESSPSGKTNQLSTKYWMGTAGYAAWTLWRMNFVPFVGIGAGDLTLTLKSRDGGEPVSGSQNPTFDEVIEQPGSQSTMTGSYMMVQPGIAVDFLILGNDTGSHGLTLGLRFSSMISPNRTRWEYLGRELFGGPDVGPSGGSLRVVLGYGAFRLSGRDRP